MKFRNNQKIILTIFALVLALTAFACQNSTPENSAKSGNSANTPQTNGAAPANSNAMSESKPPTMTDYPVGNAQSPSEAYRMLFAAVKSQDPAKIKSIMSKGSLDMAQMVSGTQKKPVEEILKNGYSETTFADALPRMRDERVKGGYGAVEVWNERQKKWEDIPFVLEDGSWKAAFGDLFAGKWQSPGKGQSIIEQEAANAQNPMTNQMNRASNWNTDVNMVKPKQRQ